MLVALLFGISAVNAAAARKQLPSGLRSEHFGLFAILVLAILVLASSVWMLRPTVSPVTPEQIKQYVESFDQARFSSASWHQWEIPAQWAVERKLHPDLSAPRRLLAQELSAKPNPFILGTAMRVGLIPAEQLLSFEDYYQQQRHFLFDDPRHFMRTKPILSLAQEDWLIRAAVLRKDLTGEERDYLERRLHATMQRVSTDQYAVLETPLRVTQLLEAIDRPVDPARYRATIHDLLMRFHSKQGGGFQPAGGFRRYLNIAVGSLDATSHAVQLMEIYGIPEGLDLNWVRSYLRPQFIRQGTERLIAAVTLERLERLPGVAGPTWLEMTYYERSLLAAIVLVALCVYAVWSSPMPQFDARNL